ncbi:hypothetical protein FRC17_006938 [Serendipita sp. 399]|nr:hypothetical protein FRC17_006938 [Serendipita sp. 399]
MCIIRSSTSLVSDDRPPHSIHCDPALSISALKPLEEIRIALLSENSVSENNKEDLELRVELLSASKDEAFKSMEGMMQDLVRENQALRQLVRDLSSFIGEGVGGFLPKLGWDIANFEEFNPLQPSPGSHASESVHSIGSAPPQDYTPHPSTLNQKPYLSVPITPTQPGPSFLNTRAPQAPPPPPPTPLTNAGSSGLDSYNPKPNTPSAASGSYPLRNISSVASDGSATPSLSTSISHPDDPWNAQREEAGKLIHYHLSNFKRNPAYRLPTSLRPTQIQRTVAHEFMIDGIPIPDVRDKFIMFKGSFDLAESIALLLGTSKIHSDDLLVHTNWELSEEWFTRFGFLATPAVLDVSNKWRRERHEPEIPSSVLKSEESSYETSGTQK